MHDHRALLRAIHGDTINWIEEEGTPKMTQDWETFKETTVWGDRQTGKWYFRDKPFKRAGQAVKAARAEWVKNNPQH